MGGKGSGKPIDTCHVYYGVSDPKQDYRTVFVGTMPEVAEYLGINRLSVLARIRRAKEAGVMGTVFRLEDDEDD